MSHGPAADENLEPNLVPLLDLVLQMLMFFMITVNFAQGVTNTGESLPYSETIAPVDTEDDPIFLSVKPFRIVMPKQPKELTKEQGRKRDDFESYSDEDRKKLRARFQDNEICILIPTEQLTSYETDKGWTQEHLIRNLFNASDRLKRLGQDEKDLAEREEKDKVPPAKRDAGGWQQHPDPDPHPCRCRREDRRHLSAYGRSQGSRVREHQGPRLLGSGEKKP